jgi:hypothetical protein
MLRGGRVTGARDPATAPIAIGRPRPPPDGNRRSGLAAIPRPDRSVGPARPLRGPADFAVNVGVNPDAGLDPGAGDGGGRVEARRLRRHQHRRRPAGGGADEQPGAGGQGPAEVGLDVILPSAAAVAASPDCTPIWRLGPRDPQPGINGDPPKMGDYPAPRPRSSTLPSASSGQPRPITASIPPAPGGSHRFLLRLRRRASGARLIAAAAWRRSAPGPSSS